MLTLFINYQNKTWMLKQKKIIIKLFMGQTFPNIINYNDNHQILEKYKSTSNE